MPEVDSRSLALSLSCAIASAVAAVLLVPTITGLPRAHWKGRPVLLVAGRAALAAGLPALAVATGVLRFVVLEDVDGIVFAASIGTAAFLATLTERYGPMRGVIARVRRLATDETRAAAAKELEQFVDRARPSARNGPRLATWVSAVLNAVEHLVNHGELDAARRTLSRLDGIRLTGLLSQLRDALGASIHLHLGRHDAAADALGAIARPVQLPAVEAMVISLEALVRALDGRHSDALTRLGRWAYPEEWQMRTRLVARAHAFQASGDEAGARRTLHELERVFGARGLEIAVRVDGPASALAESMLDRASS